MKTSKLKFSLYRQKGFTLLEMMFVVTVMAVLATLGINTYQQKLLTSKIDLASLQLQQWAQAAMTYYSNEQNWPDNETVLVKKNYITNYNNPWCTNSGDTPHCFTLKIRNDPDDDKKITGVDISLNMPPELPNAYKIAEMIKGRLPNIKILGSDKSPPVSVIMGVTMPAVAKSPEGGGIIIKDILYYSSNDYPEGQAPGINTNYPCPPGYIQKIFYALEGIKQDYNDKDIIANGTSERDIPDFLHARITVTEDKNAKQFPVVESVNDLNKGGLSSISHSRYLSKAGSVTVFQTCVLPTQTNQDINTIGDELKMYSNDKIILPSY